MTREDIIEAARRTAEATGTGALSRSDFKRLTGISHYRLFPDGGWLEVTQLAGLGRHPQHNVTLSDDDLLVEFHRVASSLGRLPSWHAFGSRANVSWDTVRKRFGGRQGTLDRYRVWLEEHDPASPRLPLLELAPRTVPDPDRDERGGHASTIPAEATNTRGAAYGAPMDFRGLRHAPINEQGVVYLFGMISRELGFLVEAIHTSYPDCEAKRCIDGRGDRWHRVRIEFEYRSGNFRDHGHDPNGCDLVVCWAHDWPECPVEVVELRRVINDLPDEPADDMRSWLRSISNR